MAFTEYLNSKRNLLVFWFLFHTFALFVNYFQIEGLYSIRRYAEHVESGDDDNYYIFTKAEDFKDSKQKFWPFVKFIVNKNEVYKQYGWQSKYNPIDFNGIFYEYDISEFIAYSLLVILVLYLKWNSKKKKKIYPRYR